MVECADPGKDLYWRCPKCAAATDEQEPDNSVKIYPWKEVLSITTKFDGSRVHMTFEQADGSLHTTHTMKFSRAIYWKVLAQMLLIRDQI
jgi:hypothetical protein